MTAVRETDENGIGNGVQRDGRGKFVKGSASPSRGRPRGRRNDLTVEVKTLVRQALSELGGVQYLKWAAREHPAPFLALLRSLVPHEIRAELDVYGVPTISVRSFVADQDRAGTIELLPTVSPERSTPVAEVVEIPLVSAADVLV